MEIQFLWSKKMNFKYSMPFPAYITGASESELELKTEFEHKFKRNKLIVRFELSGEKPLSSDSLPEGKKYVRRVNNVDFFIENFRIGEINESNYISLFKVLVSIANRVIRNIRNFGYAGQVKQIYPNEGDAEHYIRAWKTLASADGKNWQAVVPGDNLASLFIALGPAKFAEIRASSCPDIEEAIQDDLDSPPEQEFMTNSLEHLGNRNYRLALLESIICLEIVLNQYMSNYLSIHIKIPKNRIVKFLTPQLGLTARISSLLNLCLHPDDIKKIEFNKILKAIDWRNKIIHKSGHLPEGLKDEDLIENISSVLDLASMLARRRDQINASPEMQEIAKKISEKFAVPIPTIWLLKRHRILIDLVFFVVPSNFPETEMLTSIAEEATSLLSARDPRFRPIEHLYIKFSSFPNDVKARWQKGQLQ